MAEKYGAKWLFGIGTFIAAILTLVAPLAADFGVAAFIIVRVLQGLAEVFIQTFSNFLIGIKIKISLLFI